MEEEITMTINDLQHLMEQHKTSANSGAMHDLLKRLRKKPFYYWNKFKREGGAQSFNDMIGLPKKNGIPQPFCDYQYMIYKALIIPNYINSKPTTGYPLCHSMTEKKLKEKEREQYLSCIQTQAFMD